MRTLLGILVAALVLIPRPGLAQTPARSRGWADVNFLALISSGAPETTFEFPFVIDGQDASIGAIYPTPSRATQFGLPDIGGGVMFGKWLGAGASWTSGFASWTYTDGALSSANAGDTVGLTATIPHPLVLNAHATGTGVTAERLRRLESALNMFVAFVPYESDKILVRIYGGPSYFWYKADMVQDVGYLQEFSTNPTSNVVTITDYFQEDDVKSTFKVSTIGFHVGGDFAFFFSKAFGVGAGVRYSDGKANVEFEPMSEDSQDISMGGTSVFVGLRFRFGR